MVVTDSDYYCYFLDSDISWTSGQWYRWTVIQLDSDRQPELWVSHPMLVPELPDMHLAICLSCHFTICDDSLTVIEQQINFCSSAVQVSFQKLGVGRRSGKVQGIHAPAWTRLASNANKWRLWLRFLTCTTNINQGTLQDVESETLKLSFYHAETPKGSPPDPLDQSQDR